MYFFTIGEEFVHLMVCKSAYSATKLNIISHTPFFLLC